MPEPLIVVGCGGHAKVMIEAVLQRDAYRKIIVLDDAEEALGKRVLGIPVSGNRESLSNLSAAMVALGVGNNIQRDELRIWLRDRRYGLETIIHPRAFVAPSVYIGDGSFIGAGAIVIGEARVGPGAIINTAATVDHDCVIAEAAHIGPGAHLSGDVHVGSRTLIGVGAAVAPGIRIGGDVVIGAGSVVVSDIHRSGTYVGNPAKPLERAS